MHKKTSKFTQLFSAHDYSPADYAERIASLLPHYAGSSTELVDLHKALGRTVAEPIHAFANSPAFDNSQMDGYVITAVAAQAQKREFLVGHDIPAGYQGKVTPNDYVAHPIMTGAPVPAGFSAVVPVEQSHAVDSSTDAQGFVAEGGRVFLPQTQPGAFVRTIGEDIAVGTQLVEEDTVVQPAHLGVLAGQGMSDIPVRSRPKILLYTGGEEVQDASVHLQAGKIYDANAPLVVGMLAADKMTNVISRRITDDALQFQEILFSDVLEHSPDIIFTCGGISAGRYEVVRNALTALASAEKAECWFGHISQQPGGPQGVSVLYTTDQSIPVISLPGNPVSTLVTYTTIVRAALNETYALGLDIRPMVAQLQTTATVKGLGSKTQFRRGNTELRLSADGTVTVLTKINGGAGSHLLHAASASNSLIELEPGGEYKNNDLVRIWYLPKA